MKPAPFDYVAPATVAEAARLLDEAGGGATLLAGGQTLMPLLALRMSQPFVVVDVNGVAGMRGVESTASGLRIGAATRQNAIIADPLVADELPVLAQAMRHVGHQQTRARGTIGGSVAFGEPVAEMPATMVALGAELEATSVRGTRRIPAAGMYFGPYATALEPDEVMSAIHLPGWPRDSLFLFREIMRRPGDFALVGLVGALAHEDGRVTRAGLAWFGMGPTPVRAARAEAALVGMELARIDAAAIAEVALAETAPMDDHHATADYRRTVGRRMFARTLREAIGDRGERMAA